ncbi:GmrSD restriction endonuclease domain-containing protein [Aeromicrobium wangtongii]|uniref:GmrSD restriction endonuclease domain-containing protein n=1 Tax=Aeromicrobium wangtongii TaxID=2969247 RepID=UPI0020179821|nr:DUF262 domain-containing protein [Aeromicrobium wangtongii]MCL3818357.1 DUF262 domain-containing protein [Aeromicrobium wangtongii]
MTITDEDQTLQQQIDSRRREIQTEGYPMSVGELINLYRDEELDIHPEFQRFFRWSDQQKSRLIESLLLGIPIPSIFVFQRRDGVWDVIDGLQRLSTIYEFLGLLRGEDGSSLPASKLVGTEYLPALEAKTWDGAVGTSLTPEQQRLIKRASIDVKIVRRESDESTKFDLFQRLNTGGSQLSDQEVRNCLLIMAGADYYRWILTLRANSDFQATIALSDRAAAEQYDMELALRFVLLKDLDAEGARAIGDLSDFLNHNSVREATGFSTADTSATRAFEETFAIVNEALGDLAFRRYDTTKGRFLGGFSVSSFEAVTIGVYTHLAAWKALKSEDRSTKLTQLVSQIWNDPEFRDNSGSGVRANTRLARTLPYARSHFQP